ncbi:hypothetical protein wVul_1788 [Wolbachia endosymbiont of Armadillidium vulgare str. wVulC]|uniref:membrane protein n=1 Tax=Wolbachia endosymbiont of Armadillidium vulgare TaxID=77039 RepID=UPI00064A5F8A|nr:membrane protein [Wolbachia endosymbiont of Armadillidium vulgare]KLT22043.1 hypothetical protein wVul_1788 [Wolbachia endosymbiont of Armadillidium vulgare str. wVulC]OJH31037.1 hypothetical protein Wxf_00411 [Wolbachia endosymbiont of Armadillidium vulgare]OJH33096.1 hypothetical protein Wxf_02566 [Wolbachia endosymbiont of Armadillidium vulgare]
MGECCKNNTTKQAESTAKKLVNNLKSSIFCGTKGFLTFNLAFLSYLEYSSHHNTELKKGAAFAMKRNTIPFLEMAVIVPFVCFALPAMVGSISLIQCALICAALMVATCFFVRTFHVREELMEKIINHSRKEIDTEFKKDAIKFPIFDQNRKHIEYNSPNLGQPLYETSSTSLFVKVLLFPLKVLLKVLQSCIMLSLAAVELLETVPSLFVDTFFDWSFTSTKSNLQRSGHLLYASVRNLVPVTKLDECVANFIGAPEVTCCK